ncbi:MAG: hypothetical protein JOS17DRAFT_766978 [Linnemannia elongata]|nr:MAG: hypothetical protein JOS17DRAFT_766978 [Linnemannia elongata]
MLGYVCCSCRASFCLWVFDPISSAVNTVVLPWMLFFGTTLPACTSIFVARSSLLHLAYTTQLGVDIVMAAVMVRLISGGSAFGRIIIGQVSDKIGYISALSPPHMDFRNNNRNRRSLLYNLRSLLWTLFGFNNLCRGGHMWTGETGDSDRDPLCGVGDWG